MSEGQWKRLEAVMQVERGAMSNGEAAKHLRISPRQMRRVRQRVARLGKAGVIHGNTGRVPAHRIADEIREQVEEMRLGKYADFNDQHFTEKLKELEQLDLSRSTVRRILRAAGIRSTRVRRPPRHRRRRERRRRAGMMVLWDASQHRWLEGRGPTLCLMGALDDASGELLAGAHFVRQECAAGYLRMLQAICQVKGIPWSIYMDRHASLHRNDDHWTAAELQRGVQDPTQVGRALQALEIECIYALSPQAKGRVERMWGTLQDRLVSELRLNQACTLEQANAVLQRFIPDYNRRFARPPAQKNSAWRASGPGVDLVRVCSFGYQCTVLNDNTVRLNRVVIDIPPGPQRRGYARARVEVRQLLDGSWRVYYRDQLIATAASSASPGRELRALKGRYHWAPPAAAARNKKERAGHASSALASTKKLSGAPHRMAGANPESSVFRPRSQSKARSAGEKLG